LGFTLKENVYLKNDWLWLLAKVEKKIHAWCNQWLSRVDKLVMVNAVLESIPNYWITLA
jgi:hypothetical protein